MNQTKELLLFFSGNTLAFRISEEGEKVWKAAFEDHFNDTNVYARPHITVATGDTCIRLDPNIFIGYQIREVSPLEHSVLVDPRDPYLRRKVQ